MRKLIYLLATITVVVAVFTTPVPVPCCWCGRPVEFQPRFIHLGFPLPNSIHWECSRDADYTRLRFRSYPTYDPRSCGHHPPH